MTPDDLDRLLAAATPARWSVKHNVKHDESRVYAGTNQRAVLDGRLLLGQQEDAELVVALRNLAPALIRLWRAAIDLRDASAVSFADDRLTYVEQQVEVAQLEAFNEALSELENHR